MIPQSFNWEDFSFDLPESLIAKYPPENRGSSKVMVVPQSGDFKHLKNIDPLLDEFKEGDTIVYNSARVSHRRVMMRTEKNRIHEVLFLSLISSDGIKTYWRAIVRNLRKLKYNDKLYIPGSEIFFTYINREDTFAVLSTESIITEDTWNQYGEIPIPPYLNRRADPKDTLRYQTVFSRVPGSVASPTAGLHFYEDWIEKLKSKGVHWKEVHLQIGYGTFQPLEESQFQRDALHEESIEMTEETANHLNWMKSLGNRIFCLGTTSLRNLESFYDFSQKKWVFGQKSTEIFLYPGSGRDLSPTDGLITNFHLPKSSLYLLVAFYGGTDLVKKAYHTAIQNNYRFYSYGDCMFLQKCLNPMKDRKK